MPKYLGVKFGWKVATSLENGDELLFDSGRRVVVNEVGTDDNGLFLELSDGEGGYVDAGHQYRVIS